jgi:hypothetical protein
MVAMVCVLLLLPILGQQADKLPSNIVVPAAFFVRGMSALCFV